ncbi:hypothetical protein COLO4_33913 [Corchorus olitorius]|uniref:Uncharacterized protein n=1 Tax=Corchorus olitorius TaxID=93759 RepID=A0A1R3GQ64_9ROSI|nr:hypothetical protein COLO4_33913 [Corchorus olitorius]
MPSAIVVAASELRRSSNEARKIRANPPRRSQPGSGPCFTNRLPEPFQTRPCEPGSSLRSGRFHCRMNSKAKTLDVDQCSTSDWEDRLINGWQLGR